MNVHPILERDILKGCRDLLESVGWLIQRNNTGRFQVGNRWVSAGRNGSADLYAIIPPSGRFLAVEVKRPGKEPTEAQRTFLRRIRNFGGVGVAVDNVKMLDRIVKALIENPEVDVNQNW